MSRRPRRVIEVVEGGEGFVGFISLLAVFEAVAGVLVVSGGRKTQLGYLAVIAFYLALWPFGWIETAWVLIMLPAMLLLLRAERRATPAAHGGTPAAALRHA